MGNAIFISVSILEIHSDASTLRKAPEMARERARPTLSVSYSPGTATVTRHGAARLGVDSMWTGAKILPHDLPQVSSRMPLVGTRCTTRDAMWTCRCVDVHASALRLTNLGAAPCVPDRRKASECGLRTQGPANAPLACQALCTHGKVPPCASLRSSCLTLVHNPQITLPLFPPIHSIAR